MRSCLSLIVKIALYFKNLLTNTFGLIFSVVVDIFHKNFKHKKQYKDKQKGPFSFPCIFLWFIHHFWDRHVKQTNIYAVSILWMSHCITETSLLSVLLLTNQKSIQIHTGQVGCNKPWTHPKTQLNLFFLSSQCVK